jgi:hypothetical protein
VSKVRLEALNKADTIIRWERRPFIILKEATLEELYREYESKIRFERDYEMFRNLKPKLLMDEKHRGKWVAVVNGKLLGPSDDDSELSGMIDEKYGNVVAYIGRIVEEKEILSYPRVS